MLLEESDCEVNQRDGSLPQPGGAGSLMAGQGAMSWDAHPRSVGMLAARTLAQEEAQVHVTTPKTWITQIPAGDMCKQESHASGRGVCACNPHSLGSDIES